MTEAIEQPPAKKWLSGTTLRVVTVLPLIPFIIWMMFAAPSWVWPAFVLVAIAIGGYELMSMKVPSSRGLRAWGAVTSALFGYAIIFVNDAATTYGAVLIIIVGSMTWSLLQDDPLQNASVRIGWLLGTPIYVGGTLSAVAMVRSFDPTGAWVLLTMVLAWGSDTSASEPSLQVDTVAVMLGSTTSPTVWM